MSKTTVSAKQVSSTSDVAARARPRSDVHEVLHLAHVPGDESSSAASEAIGR